VNVEAERARPRWFRRNLLILLPAGLFVVGVVSLVIYGEHCVATSPTYRPDAHVTFKGFKLLLLNGHRYGIGIHYEVWNGTTPPENDAFGELMRRQVILEIVPDWSLSEMD
jgi:hypothetical protein